MKGPLAEKRQNFQTQLTTLSTPGDPPPAPPSAMFDLIQYDSPVGKLWAYVSVRPKDGKRHPAIIWLFGGFGNDIGATAWEKAPLSNDQSARAFREAGIIMMYPSLRGGNDNPGHKEAFLGEVDDVLAATEYLSRQNFVSPERIYLGGHSTGGTLAVLTSECSDRFRAVFAFGPVDEVVRYGGKNLPFAAFSDRQEQSLRSPGEWLDAVQCPLFMFEGDQQPGNLASLAEMKKSKNPLISCSVMPGANHFSTLAPETKIIARKILADTTQTTNTQTTNIKFTIAGK